MRKNIYKILKILREPSIIPTYKFYIILQNKDVYKFLLARSMYQKIIKGMLYENDFVRIVEIVNDEAIVEKINLSELKRFNRKEYKKFDINKNIQDIKKEFINDTNNALENKSENNLNKKTDNTNEKNIIQGKNLDLINYENINMNEKLFSSLNDYNEFKESKINDIKANSLCLPNNINFKTPNLPSFLPLLSFLSDAPPLFQISPSNQITDYYLKSSIYKIKLKSKLYKFQNKSHCPFYFLIITNQNFRIFFYRENAIEFSNLKQNDEILITKLRKHKKPDVYSEKNIVECEDFQIDHGSTVYQIKKKNLNICDEDKIETCNDTNNKETKINSSNDKKIEENLNPVKKTNSFTEDKKHFFSTDNNIKIKKNANSDKKHFFSTDNNIKIENLSFFNNKNFENNTKNFSNDNKFTSDRENLQQNKNFCNNNLIDKKDDFKEIENQNNSKFFKKNSSLNIPSKDKKITKNIPFLDLHGKITFISDILRSRDYVSDYLKDSCYIEEFLYVTIDNKFYVKLLNNGEEEFNKLSYGSFVSFNNMWLKKRGKFFYFSSSIYSEIKILEYSEFEMRGNGFLPDFLNNINDLAEEFVFDESVFNDFFKKINFLSFEVSSCIKNGSLGIKKNNIEKENTVNESQDKSIFGSFTELIKSKVKTYFYDQDKILFDDTKKKYKSNEDNKNFYNYELNKNKINKDKNVNSNNNDKKNDDLNNKYHEMNKDKNINSNNGKKKYGFDIEKSIISEENNVNITKLENDEKNNSFGHKLFEKEAEFKADNLNNQVFYQFSDHIKNLISNKNKNIDKYLYKTKLKILIDTTNYFLINEIQKFAFKAVIKSFDLSAFKKNLKNTDKKINLYSAEIQETGIITVFDEIHADLIVMRNNFICETNEEILKRIDFFSTNNKTMIDQEFLFLADVVRISENDIVFYVSRILSIL